MEMSQHPLHCVLCASAHPVKSVGRDKGRNALTNG